MPRPEKVQAVEEIKERFDGSVAVFLTEYRGLSVAEQQELRRNLREAETEYKVVKMSLARRAVDELGIEDVVELLSGPTALAFTEADPVLAAKALSDFAKDHAALLIKGGLLRGRLLPPEKVSELADLEPREVLLARVAGGFQAPMVRMAGLMQALTRNTATVLSQLLERKESEEAGPAEDAASVEETAEPGEETTEAEAEETAETTEPEETVETDEAEAEETAETTEPEETAEAEQPDEATEAEEEQEDEEQGEQEEKEE